MRRMLIVIAAAAALLVPAALATAKGPTSAVITGLESGSLAVDGGPGSGEPGSGATLAGLAEVTGLWANTFDRGDALQDSPPTAALGTRLRVSWIVPGPEGEDIAVQDVYPWAEGGAVTYTPADQDYAGTTTRGGWFVGGEELQRMLIEVGVPARQPSSGPPPVPLLAVGTVVVAGAGLLAWRRRPAPRREAEALATT